MDLETLQEIANTYRLVVDAGVYEAESIKVAEAAKVLKTASSLVYGDHPVLPKKEGQEGNLLSPYALTKRVDEEYGKLCYKLYGLDTYGILLHLIAFKSFFLSFDIEYAFFSYFDVITISTLLLVWKRQN